MKTKWLLIVTSRCSLDQVLPAVFKNYSFRI